MAQEIKKTMVEALEFVKTHGRMKEDKLEEFITKFCIKKDGATATTPREVTILKDVDGNQLGRKCSVTGLWFPNEAFSKGTSCIKLADSAKGKIYAESKKMEKDAQSLLDEARDLTDIQEKVAKFTEYDEKLLAAKEYRLQPVPVTDEMKQGGFESIEALAKHLKVKVNPVKPTGPEAE